MENLETAQHDCPDCGHDEFEFDNGEWWCSHCDYGMGTEL